MNEGSSAAVPTAEPLLLVLYDGACPLCRREITIYRGLRSEVERHTSFSSSLLSLFWF